MHAVWYGLMVNLAVVTLFVAGWTYVQTLFDHWPPAARSLALGLFLGLGAIMAMLTSFSLQPGINIDLRTTLVSSAGLFGGPVGGLAAALMAAAFRLHLGGTGAWGGSITIFIVLGLSLGLQAVTRRRELRVADVLVLALLISLLSFVAAAVVPNQPGAIGQVAVPSAVLHFVSSLLAGLAMLHDGRRRVALRENQTYRTIIEALPDSLNVKDREGRFIAANPATALLMQAGSAAELIGKTDADFYPPELAARFRADELEVIAKGEQVRVEQTLPNPEGAPRFLSTLKVPLFDDRGAPAGIITHNRDVTERGTLLAALEASQQQLSYAMAQMADGVAMFDKDGRMVFCNEQY
ncbi:MAG: PAS domain-containing protein, partial [Devosia sp.]